MLRGTEKQVVNGILIESQDNFAAQRRVIGTNTQFKVTITSKDDKALYKPKPNNANPREKRPDC